MSVFKDLDMVVHLGSGIPRILESYDKEAFKFSDNFLRMTFPKAIVDYSGVKDGGHVGGQVGGAIGGAIGGTIDEIIVDLTDRQKEVLKIISDNSKVSIRTIAGKLGINDSAAQQHVDKLKEKGVIERVGGTRGYWIIKTKNQ